MGLSGDNLNLKLPEKDVLALEWLERFKICFGEGFASLLGLTIPALKLRKSPENPSEWDRRGHPCIQYFPLTVEYTEAQCAEYLPAAPPGLPPTIPHPVLYLGWTTPMGSLPPAPSLDGPQGSLKRRSEGKKSVTKGHYFFKSLPAWVPHPGRIPPLMAKLLARGLLHIAALSGPGDCFLFVPSGPGEVRTPVVTSTHISTMHFVHTSLEIAPSSHSNQITQFGYAVCFLRGP